MVAGTTMTAPLVQSIERSSAAAALSHTSIRPMAVSAARMRMGRRRGAAIVDELVPGPGHGEDVSGVAQGTCHPEVQITIGTCTHLVRAAWKAVRFQRNDNLGEVEAVSLSGHGAS